MNSALINPYCADTIVGMIAALMIPNNTIAPVKLIRFLLFFLLLNWTIGRGIWHVWFNSLEVSISVDVTSTWFVVGWNGTKKKMSIKSVLSNSPQNISMMKNNQFWIHTCYKISSMYISWFTIFFSLSVARWREVYCF